MPDEPLAKVNVNLAGDFGAAANTLVEKIAAATGVLYAPTHVRRMAKAEVDADRIRLLGELDRDQLRSQATARALKQELNCALITDQALLLLTNEPTESPVEEDWLANFFDKAKLVSDEHMQQLWSRVLAGEANSPGKFSKRTVNLLSELSNADATLFEKICSFCCVIENDPICTIISEQFPIYSDRGINFAALTHLEGIGLIRVIRPGYSLYNFAGETIVVRYFNEQLTLNVPKGGEVRVGIVKFTEAGEQLLSLATAFPVAGFIDFLKERWKSHLCKASPTETESTELLSG